MSCSRTEHSEAGTRGPSVSIQALYHCAPYDDEVGLSDPAHFHVYLLTLCRSNDVFVKFDTFKP